MSAYVVEDETINGVVAWLVADAQGSGQVAVDVLRSHGYGQENFERLARAMFQLNVEAVRQRYDEDEPMLQHPQEFNYVSMMPPTDAQALKSLKCWLYQCSEGHVPESALYRMFREVERAIAVEIVSKLPEYEAAAWG